jgi:hypothetical protein
VVIASVKELSVCPFEDLMLKLLKPFLYQCQKPFSRPALFIQKDIFKKAVFGTGQNCPDLRAQQFTT